MDGGILGCNHAKSLTIILITFPSFKILKVLLSVFDNKMSSVHQLFSSSIIEEKNNDVQIMFAQFIPTYLE
jgi:hypothetical protein